VIGAIAGWRAGQIVNGGGFGLLVGIIVGTVGAVIGAFLARVVGISADGIIGSIIPAAIGPVLVVLRILCSDRNISWPRANGMKRRHRRP
jgi:uncharacterized membrane protein YeaQ/YmgE (transglycosylase-associated protein family)